MDRSIMKGMLIVLAVLYIISPVDLCAGPIDDLIVVILTFAINRRKALKEAE